MIQVADIVIVEPGHVLGYTKGLLVVRKNGSTIYSISVNEVDSVVIATKGVSLSGTLLWRLAAHGIPVYIVSSKGEALALLMPVDANKTSSTQIAQAEWRIDPEKRLKAAKWFITAKLRSRIWLLRRLAASRRDQSLRDESYQLELYVHRALQASDPRELMDAEARAGRIYWNALKNLIPIELGFPGREPRRSDPVNRSLDYMYSLLRVRCHLALQLAGFNPYMGFMHVDKSGRPSLTLDYMESYRWVVEKVLLNLIASGLRPELYLDKLSKDTRKALYRALRDAFNSPVPGSRVPLGKAILRDAWSLSKAIREDSIFQPTLPRQV